MSLHVRIHMHKDPLAAFLVGAEAPSAHPVFVADIVDEPPHSLIAFLLTDNENSISVFPYLSLTEKSSFSAACCT